MDKKGIRASVNLQALVEIQPTLATPTLFTARMTADAVDRAKENLLHGIKKNIENLTIDSLKFEEVTIPDIQPIKI